MPWRHLTRGILLRHGGNICLNLPCQNTLSRTPPNILTGGQPAWKVGHGRPGSGSKKGAASMNDVPGRYLALAIGPSPYMSIMTALRASAPFRSRNSQRRSMPTDSLDGYASNSSASNTTHQWPFPKTFRSAFVQFGGATFKAKWDPCARKQ